MIGYDPSAPSAAAKASKKKGSSSSVEFTPPPGLDLTGKQPGDEFEAVVKLELQSGGKVCIEAINGIPMGSDSDSDDDDTEQQNSDMADGTTDPNVAQSGEAPDGETFTAAIARRSKNLK